MNSFVPFSPTTFTTGQASSSTIQSCQKQPWPLNRPPSDVNVLVESALGQPSRPRGPPKGDDGDSDNLRRALQRYYGALSAHQGDVIVELEKTFNTDLRTLSGEYERKLEDLNQTDRELMILIQRNLECLEEDLKYHAKAGYEAMGSRLAGRFAGPCSTNTLVEATLQWWRNPRDRKLVKDVRDAADMVTMRRARGSEPRMQQNRVKVEELKRTLANLTGEHYWKTCLTTLGLDANDLNMVRLFVAAAEHRWRIAAGNEYSEYAVDLGADMNSEKCMIFPLPFPASAKDELLPVMAIKGLNDEMYGLLTGDRWFKVHSADGIDGAIILARYVEVDEQPETWAVSEHRHRIRISALTAKDCAWLAQLLCGELVDEVTLLYENLIRHAQRGHLPDGREVGVSVVGFREALERKRILTTAGALQMMTVRTVSAMFSLTESRRAFSRALAELVLGTVTAATVIRSGGKRVEIQESQGKWCFQVTGSPTKRTKDLEAVLAALMRLAGKRGISCDVEGADIHEEVVEAPTLRPMQGRIGLSCLDLWNSKRGIPVRLDSLEE